MKKGGDAGRRRASPPHIEQLREEEKPVFCMRPI